MAVLPEMVTHFDVSREKSIQAIERAMEGDQLLFLAAQKDVEVEDPGSPMCMRQAAWSASGRC